MAEKDQVRPLAPSVDHAFSDDGKAAGHLKRTRHRRLKCCCVYTAANLIVLAIVILILCFTVFKVKHPKITTHEITVKSLELSLNPVPQLVKVNLSLNVDVSIKNPNAASFELNDASTVIYYHGVALVEARPPPAEARARRTLRMNVTVDIMADHLMSVPELAADVIGGQLPLSSYTAISGRVAILNIIKIHVGLKMNCSMSVSISNKSTENMSCDRQVKL